MSQHTISVLLTGNPSSLRGALLAAGRDVEKFNSGVQTSGKEASKAGQFMQAGLKAGVLAVGVAMAYGVAKAAAFDRELRNVQSITKQSDASLKKTGGTLIEMSTRLPQSAETLAAGLYDIASSGFAGADGLKVLEASAMAASAGITETAVSAKAITAVLNAYGLTADDAADVSDSLFQTVNLGVVTFEELSGTIGDVVGTAAAATVSIHEVDSAIATMTLSGISASEAGTSLNRLIQGLIDPSDELAAKLNELGYESGAQALKVDDLSIVIEKLRVASGGEIETLLKWFPEIRSARGALALMANEGKNYTKVVAGIEVAENRAGATQAALNEQMKSLSAQWTLFKNNVDAAAITLGMALIPSIISVLNTVKELGQSGIPILMDVFRRLEPFIDGVAGTVENLAGIFEELWHTIDPVVSVVGALLGLGIITFLNAWAKAAEAVTGAMEDHPNIVKALAVVLGAIYLPAIIATTQATLAARVANLKYAASFKLLQAQEFLKGVMAQVSMFTTLMTQGLGPIQSFKAAFAGLGTGVAVGGALVAVTLAVQAFRDEMGKASEDAKSWAKGFAGDFDPAKVTFTELTGEINRIQVASGKMQEAADNAINPFLDKRLKTARDELDATATPLVELRDKATELSQALGITANEALKYATDAEYMAEVTDGATGELDAQAAAALATQEALAELDAQLKAMFDPFFGLQDAANKLTEAQAAAATALREHGAASKEYIDANTAAVRAAVDYQGALANLKAAVVDGSTSVESSIGTLYSWAEQGIITKAQADQAAESIRTLGKNADDTDGTDILITADAVTANANAKIDATRNKANSLDGKTATVTVLVNDQQFRNQMAGMEARLNALRSQNVVIGTTRGSAHPAPKRASRWGNLLTFADGGVTPAHIGRGDLIRYAEPETGGEAYVPRLGDPKRSKGILDVAAGWYGMKVVPMAAGGTLTGYQGAQGGRYAGPYMTDGPAGGWGHGGADVRVIIDGRGVDRALLEWLRKSIRTEGGGNVQVALGTGGR